MFIRAIFTICLFGFYNLCTFVKRFWYTSDCLLFHFGAAFKFMYFGCFLFKCFLNIWISCFSWLMWFLEMEGRKISVCFKEDEAFWKEWRSEGKHSSLIWGRIFNFSEILNFSVEFFKKLLKILTVIDFFAWKNYFFALFRPPKAFKANLSTKF